MMKKIKYIIMIMMSFLLIFNTAFITDVAAVERLDTSMLSDLTIHFEYDGTKISGAVFSLYKVAGTDDFSTFSLTDTFSSYQIDLDNNDTDSWTRMGTTLKGYVLRDNIPSRGTETTDTSGESVFSGLEPGIYLVIGNSVRTSKYTYEVMPFVIAIPAIEENKWNYHVFSEVKSTRKTNSNGKNYYTSVKAVKEWKDSGYESNRPEYIEVQLLRNNSVFKTEKLSEKNNWTITWDSLDNKYDWTVVEESVPDNYTVTITVEGNTSTITNTYLPPDKPQDDPADNPSDNPSNDPSDNPGDKNNPKDPTSTTTDKKSNLPKTGDYYHFEVWLSLLVAALVVMIGIIVKNRRRNNI